ncbi:MAG: Glu/Leu/Phe/Val dehydrogenase dimerization domain-containing protein [Chloroflexia bacterium]
MAIKVQSETTFEVAQKQFDIAADRLGLDERLRRVLRTTKRELTVHFPVTMDNGEVEIFTGYRVQHNVGRGPARAAYAITPTSRSTRCERSRCG